MSLARTARALARLAAQPCGSSGGLPALSSLRPAQQLVSLWGYTPAQGFAASAAAAQAEPAAAEPPAAAAAAELPPVYTPLGQTVGEGYSVQPKQVFAVVEVGGTQYKVTPDDVIVVEKLGDVDVNEKLRLQRVLLLGSAAETVIGRPYVPGAAVEAAVEEQFLDGKVLIFHKRRRKNSRRLRGHRQPLTTLRILDVHGIEAAPEAEAAAAAAGR
ncbi:Ribosomal L21 [Chlorella sorokiniana]|uniref:Large ribosomal subunit protein bL21m n=1 Tax=Chlorella sorokiniana TaxID=3076 RepID=A0A2P6U504_CHLSO|nr:Ribosomal L21 [Chlorella sorokiniana]|eukprot:PRW61400.1 Ribosomal L21 [Chlorella sorokiniana]